MKKPSLYRQLLTTSLLIGGTFYITAPVLAAGTTAGTSISNTASATYEDPNNAGVRINVTSNTVTVTVAEIAGITNTPSGIIDTNGGTIQTNDVLNYNYTITNVGNDPTKVFIPSTAAVSGPGALFGAIQYSTDNGATYTNVPAGGTTTIESIAVNGTVLVRVPVQVSNTATAGSTISVVLGDTGANDNSALTQNQPDAADGTLAQEVRTVDNADGSVTGEAVGLPRNGEREASAQQSIITGDLPQMVNGPSGAAGATGPTSTNDDYTNKSTFVAPGTNPANPVDPDPISFTNTVQNTSATDPITLSLLPTPPAIATDLPINTLVTISFLGQSATYRYDGTTFVFVSGVGANPSDATLVSQTNPVELSLLTPGETANYTVTVDLPSSAQLSAYSTPVTAFADTNKDGLIGALELQNITIDRIYTGYLSLLKESRILPGTGPAVNGSDGTFSLTPKSPAPGNIIEYRITYTNVSSGGGSNSIVLNANKIAIVEDGTTALSVPGGNNWAIDNDSNGSIDTSHVIGSAVDPAGSITFGANTVEQSGTTTATDSTLYVNTVTNPLAPSSKGIFTFQRKVN